MAAVLRRAGWVTVAARNGGVGAGAGSGFSFGFSAFFAGPPCLLRFRSNIAGGGGQSREAEAIMAEIEEMIENERASSLLTLMSDLRRYVKLGGSRIGRMEADLEERVRMLRDLARRAAKTADDMEELREKMDAGFRVLNEKLRSTKEELERLRWYVTCVLRTVAAVSVAGAGAMVLAAVTATGET